MDRAELMVERAVLGTGFLPAHNINHGWEAGEASLSTALLLGGILAVLLLAGGLYAQCRRSRRQRELQAKTEEELRTSKEWLQQAIRISGLGIVSHDLHTDVLEWSPRLREIRGVGPEEPASIQKLLELTHPEDRPKVAEAVARAQDPQGDGLYLVENRVLWPDGTVRWVSQRGQMFFEGQGPTRRPARLVGVAMDITDSKRVEAELRTSAELLQQAVHVSGLGIFDYNHLTDTLQWSPRLREMRGLPPDKPVTIATMLECVHPEDRQKMIDGMRRSEERTGDGVYLVEARMLWPDGTVRWLTERGRTFFEGEGPARRPVRSVGVAMDITDLKRAEEELRASEELFRAFFDSVAVGTCLVEPGGRFLQVNDRYCEIVGYSREELLQMTPLDLYYPEAPEDLERYQGLIAQFHEGQVPAYEVEQRRVRKDGTVIWMQVNASMLRDRNGRPLRIAGVCQDITKRKMAEDALAAARQSAEQARSAAEAASQAKSQFLAHMSHELRTPMNSILGMTELALLEPLSAGVRDDLQTVKESADVLLTLINEVLDLSRIEAGVPLLEWHPFQLHLLLEETLKTVALRGLEKGLELACHVAPTVPDQLIGDPLRLRQILSNLLGNAVKFTERGGVVLRVDVETDSSAEVCLRFAVTDTGIGIAPEHQRHIFEPFTQADPSMTRRFGGSGLGLAIVSRLVAMMEGRVGLESRLGQGSTFWCTVPLRRSTGPNTSDPQPLLLKQRKDLPVREEPRPIDRFEPTAPRPLRILLAEDTPANQKVAVHLLSRRGHTVTVAQNGQETVDRLGREPFDVVLMDVQMPVMDGFQATGEIRRLQQGTPTRTPIIAMTAHALKGDRERCLAAGMDAYLSKPISGRELIALVERLADQRCGPQAAPAPEPPSGTPVEPLPFKMPTPPAVAQTGSAEFDLDEAVRQCFGQTSVFHAMVGCFFDEADVLVAQMRSSLAQGNGEETYRVAHRLKNTVVYLGAASATEAVREIERFSKSGDRTAAAQAVGELEQRLERLKPLLAEHRPKLKDSP